MSNFAAVREYEAAVERFETGRLSPEEFKACRHRAGVYAQRQKGKFMVRVRVPAGLLSSGQAESLAGAARAWSDGWCHITTRQNLQFYGLALDDTATLLWLVAEAGLPTRGASGNGVRNIVACSRAGICPDEAFDVRPKALELTDRFLRRPNLENLPRKFKTALAGCARDCLFVRFQDFGAVAVNWDGRPGFRVYAGGGLGAHPVTAPLLFDFVPQEELGAVCEAVIRVFDRLGERRSRARGRLKFLVEQLGVVAFREEVLAERSRLKGNDEAAVFIEGVPPPDPGKGTPAETAPEFEEWRRRNVQPQKQPGYSAVTVQVPLGDVRAGPLEALAELSRSFGNGTLRLTCEQNVLLPWVLSDHLPAAHRRLRDAGLASPRRASDVVACAGTRFCPSAITNSKAMAAELVRFLSQEGKAFEGLPVEIRVAGCPNACSQAPLADIGLSGKAWRIEGRDWPAYDIRLDGARNEESPPGRSLATVPARQIPRAIGTILDFFQKERLPGETLFQFVERTGWEALRTKLAACQEAPADPSDWDGHEAFQVKTMPSEC